MSWKKSCCFKKFPELRIKQFKFWSWVLNADQDPFLGRSIVYLNRHTVDLKYVTDDEWLELLWIFKTIEKTFSKLFKPTKYNYCALGNHLEHLHFHIIPRYKKPVKFKNQIFKDIYWGDSFDLHDASIHTPKKLNMEVSGKIKNVFEKLHL